MAVANNQDTLRETQQLNQALEETRWKMSQLGSDTVRVQNDVSNAMSPVSCGSWGTPWCRWPTWG